jgi:hypothetical protein
LHILDATKLCQLIIDQYGRDACRLVVLGRGDEYAVYLKQPGYFCWCFKDFTAYRHREKQAEMAKRKKRGRGRREDECYQRAIVASEMFVVAM